MRAVQTKAPAVRQIAVKLMDDDSRPGEFPPEVTIMAKLSNVRSKHIVRVYKYARRARLQDEDGYSYIGMYMEYFPGGVLGISMNGDPDPYLILVDLWGIFYCLASALVVMKNGSEDSAEFVDDTLSLVHYDLKLDNVLLGNRDQQHQRYPIAKIGGFGFSEFENTNINSEQLAEWREKGHPGWRAPENTHGYAMEQPRKGSCTNVFKVGSLMHTLIQRKFMNPADKDKSLWKAPFTRNEYAGAYTIGAELFDKPWNQYYSKELRELVMECMMWEPTGRPSVLEVRDRVKAGRSTALEICANEGLLDDGEYPPVKNFSHIPFDDEEWLEDPAF